MKILAITDSYPPHHTGGYELRSRDVLSGLADRGHTVRIITTRCPSPNCDLHYGEKDVCRGLRKRSETPGIMSRIVLDIQEMKLIDRLVVSFKPDIVYLSHLGDLSKAILFFFSSKNLPIVFDDGGAGMVFISRVFREGLYFNKRENDSIVKTEIKRILSKLISVISGNLIPNELTWPKNLYVYFNNVTSLKTAQKDGVLIPNAQVFHSGIDLSMFLLKNPIDLESPVRIIVPGRIEPNKGTRDVISLVSILEKLGVQSSVIIVGSIGDQLYYNELLDFIKQLNLTSEVQLFSMVHHKRLAEMYRESDMCFFPSYQKAGLSRVPLEAMASGCLVISYGNEGSSEIIRNNETGYLVEEGDVCAVVKIVKDMVEYPATYERIVRKARKYIETSRSLDIYIGEIEKYLSFIIEKSDQKC